MSMFNSSAIPVLEQVVQFTEARHGVLAGNIANLDTPGYKTQDLSPELFNAQLKKAINSRSAKPLNSGSLYPTHSTTGISGHAASETNHDTLRDVKESFQSMLRHDESDVSIERQVTEMAKNQAQHNLALSIMVSQFRLLEVAISERV